MVIFMRKRTCVQGEGESLLPTGIFFVVQQQPIGFHILMKLANHSARFIFPTLNTALPRETRPGKMQLPFFSSFSTVLLKLKADRNGPLATSGKIQNLTQQTFRLAERNTRENVRVL